MFSNETIEQIEIVARENAIETAALLAVCEVESAGRAFAVVGGKKEPLIRFEGHYFDRLLSPIRRETARKAGLAAPKWGVVKNPRGQAARWQLLDRAMRIDRAAAVQSVSWGIGQVMGSHWKALGYASPDALVAEARESVAGQIRLMVRFMRVNNLLGKLAARDWAGFARRYNGPAYRKNHYDTRMAAAYARYSNPKLRAKTVPKVALGGMLAMGARNNANAVRDMQRLLTAAGFPTKADGIFGRKTDAALRAFQQQHGLVVDGVYGRNSREKLSSVMPKVGSAAGFIRLMWSIFRVITFGKWRRKI